MKPWLKRAISICLIGLMLSTTACQSKVTNDILTQKVIAKGRTPITILVKYAFSINTFEKAVEEKFPDIDIVQVGNYTSDRGIEEYAARIEHDDLTDIVMTWPLDVGSDYWADRLIDLSGMPFTSNYNTSMLNNISKNGKLYYLPGPSQVRGIVYNKTLFEEKGWQVPKNYKEFIALCQEIEQSGIRALQLGFANSEVLDTAFVGFNYASCFSKPFDSQWIADYNNGTGNFIDHFAPALDTFENMIQNGIFRKEDLNVYYQDREKMLFSRQCAMVEDSVLIARMGMEYNGCTDEFALMPFFNPGQDSEWARLYMVCYIGLNKHLTEPANKQKYDKVLELMNYISTKEGQEALSADTGAMFSSVKGAEPPNVPEIKDLLSALEHGRYAVFPEAQNAQEALREGLAGMLRGDLTKQDVAQMVDEQNINGKPEVNPVVLGKATSDFSIIETGNFVTDAMRKASGCELALFLDNGKDGKYNGKGISGRIYQGDITTADVNRIYPDIKHGEKGVLWKVTMNGKELLNTLEHTIMVDNGIGGWFYYFSGLKMEYVPSAEPGNRIKSIEMADGSAFDQNRDYTIAVMDETVPNNFIKDCQQTEVKILSIITDAITKEKEIKPSNDGRFTVVNP